MKFHTVGWMFTYIIVLILMVYILKFHIIEFFYSQPAGLVDKPLLMI